MREDGGTPTASERFSVRNSPILAVSAAAAAALLLAGCAGGSEPDETATSPATAADLCAAAAPSGEVSDGIALESDFGTAPAATFTTPLEISEVQRTVVEEGSGQEIADGDLVSFALTAFDATTGEAQGSLGYVEGEVLPQQVSADTVLGQFLGCATIGSRIVTTLPASQSPEGQATPAAVYVFDVLSATPPAAWGTDQAPAEGLPTVVLDDDGAPTITIPDADAPTDLQLDTLKVGDGPVVQPADNVLVQYRGVKWSDGTEFDSTWSRGAPTSFQTDAVVEGFGQALEGRTVGSQVLVVIPPALGYGAQDGHELQDETLVFVVDILATQHLAPAQ